MEFNLTNIGVKFNLTNSTFAHKKRAWNLEKSITSGHKQATVEVEFRLSEVEFSFSGDLSYSYDPSVNLVKICLQNLAMMNFCRLSHEMPLNYPLRLWCTVF
jgi:hypothetical protein